MKASKYRKMLDRLTLSEEKKNIMTQLLITIKNETVSDEETGAEGVKKKQFIRRIMKFVPAACICIAIIVVLIIFLNNNNENNNTKYAADYTGVLESKNLTKRTNVTEETKTQNIESQELDSADNRNNTVDDILNIYGITSYEDISYITFSRMYNIVKNHQLADAETVKFYDMIKVLKFGRINMSNESETAISEGERFDIRINIKSKYGNVIEFTYNPNAGYLVEEFNKFYSESLGTENSGWLNNIIQNKLILDSSSAQKTDVYSKYIDMYGLWSNWEFNGYPDYVNDVCAKSTDTLIVNLVGDDNTREAAKAEILSMLIDTSSIKVEFGNATYSYNEMIKVKDTILEEMELQKNENTQEIFNAYVGWKKIDRIGIGFGASQTESRVIVDVDSNMYDKYVKKYNELYGDMVYVEIAEK